MLVGLAFVVFGMTHFVKFMDVPPPPTEKTREFMEVLGPTGYLTVVKVLEVVGGLLLLSWRFGPLGVVVLMPVAVNILLWDVLLAKTFGLGVVLVALLTILAVGYRRHFTPFFDVPPNG